MSRGGAPALAAVVCALLATACGDDPLTELVVAVDTDMVVPDELDFVRIDVIGPGGELRRAGGALDGDFRLPATLGVAHRGGDLGPVRVTVTGRLEGRDIIQRRARVDFVRERVVVLRLFLERVCLGVRCSEAETCAAGRCRDQLVDPSELEDWTGRVDRADAGSAPPVDAGPVDATVDGCAPSAEVCNGADDDCDGDVDEDFDLARDPDHCGDCDTGCAIDPQNAAGACLSGTCGLVCDPGWADCDEMEANGCEASLATAVTCGACDVECTGATPLCATSGGSAFECVTACGGDLLECSGSCVDTRSAPQHCGACTTSCSSPSRATAVCAESRCGYVCDSGFRDCDGAVANGCESQLRDLANCGACGAACTPRNALASCVTGVCAIVACSGSYADCNATVSDGCEADTLTDVDNCGACGTMCPIDPANAVATCASGRCRITCEPGFEDCNGLIDDGCEASLADSTTCGSCGIRCEGMTPLCAPAPAGSFECVADCGASGTLCEGSCTDIDTDARHCGGCGTSCPSRARATRLCAGGACGFDCDPGWGDCDAMPGTGCEAALNTVANCGSCGNSCAPAHGTGACVMAACALAGCEPGWDDCDRMLSTGCEIDLTMDLENCGACGTVCAEPDAATATCVDRVCGFDCDMDRGDCDGASGNGCEVDLSNATANCGACGTDCAALTSVATASCAAGACVIETCVTDHVDCNGMPADGCEVDTSSDPLNCGGCGTDCTALADVATASCSMGVCVIDTCATDRGDCNGTLSDGCESDTSTDPLNCGVCGTDCMGASCVAGSCS